MFGKHTTDSYIQISACKTFTHFIDRYSLQSTSVSVLHLFLESTSSYLVWYIKPTYVSLEFGMQ